ncbi:MAG: PAS domain-containing sensor histidine kinase [Candidatus Nanopelagicales bacterium]
MTRTVQQRSVRRFVALVGVLGAALATVVVVLGVTVWADIVPKYDHWTQWLLFGAFATVGQLAYVKVRHGATNEELTFFEVVLAAAVLTLQPVVALTITLAGMLVGELIIRREPIKLAYNLGTYAAGTSAMIITYRLAFPTVSGSQFSLHSVLSLLTASLVFTIVNLVIVAQLMRVTMGSPPREILSEEWRLSAFIAVSSVGIGMMAVALAEPQTAWLVPFVLLPALSLRYAYGAAAQQAEALERNRWLVRLGGALAQHGQGEGVLEDSTEAIRQIVGAPEMTIAKEGSATSPDALASLVRSLAPNAAPQDIPGAALPLGWHSGVAMQLDLGTDAHGALLLGSDVRSGKSLIAGRTRGWSLAEADAPVLGALVAAVGSAMRAGAAFNALTEETSKLTAVVDNTSDGIAMIDGTDTIRLWSRTLERMTGARSIDLVGRAADTAPPVVSALLEASATAQADGERGPVQVHLVRGDGEELDVALTTVWVRASITGRADEEPGWVSILTVHDETRERRVERMKSEFVATVSHELRTPLTPIKGYAPWLAAHGDRIPLAKRTEALRVIADSADHLSRLVDDLLIASQVSDGSRLGVTIGVQDLKEVVSQAVAGFPDLGARITLDLPEDAVSIQCDRVRAVQCLSNLLQNAAKYTPAGSPLEVRAEVSGMHARIHVRDHGSGIPVAEHERIFERFYRREDPFTMRTGGAGLGLNIARELAVAMGGGLVVQTPESGPGAEFVLHLATAHAPQVTAGQRLASGESMPGYRPDPRSLGKPPGPPEDSTPNATMDRPQASSLAAK